MRNQILVGDVRQTLKGIPDRHVHCCVTSPPYWNLRDYGHSEQLGSEPTPAQYIANQMEVFNEVQRVLRDDGVLWVNIGDTYSQKGKSGGRSGGKNSDKTNPRPSKDRGDDRPSGCKMMLPEQFAAAMIENGWRLRQTVIWNKPAPMPEALSGWEWQRHRIKVARGADSCEESKLQTKERPHAARAADGRSFDRGTQWDDCPGCEKCRATDGYLLRRGSWRTTNSYEVVYMFSKSERYYCDALAAAEPVSSRRCSRGNGLHAKALENAKSTRMNSSFSSAVIGNVSHRNPRSVWTIASEPMKDKHFAAFPSELPKRCILVSTSKAGCCPYCGSQRAPVVRSVCYATRPGTDSKVFDASGERVTDLTSGNRDPLRHETSKQAVDYWPTCQCPAHEPVPAIVLDPYAGSGTTLRAAHQLGRDWIGCELNPEYVAICHQRIQLPLPRRDGKDSKRQRHAQQRAVSPQKELFR